MIISASRRTDIPAFFTNWLLERLSEGFADVRNPMNYAQMRRVSLLPQDVDCFVFWSKNPAPMIPALDRLRDFPYYFQFTLNGYGADIEPRVPPLAERIDTFRRLSDLFGPARVVWRYDPILLNPTHPAEFHIDQFARIAGALGVHARRVTISYIDYYRKIAKNWRRLEIREPAPLEVESISRAVAAAAAENGMVASACAEKLPLAQYGIHPASCVDPALVAEATGRALPLPAARAKSQRPLCNCAQSVDIGSYDTCPHGCAYCYANQSATPRPMG